MNTSTIEGNATKGNANIQATSDIVFWPSGFEEFRKATSVPAREDAVAPTEPPAVVLRNVFELAADYGIRFRIDAGEIGTR